MHVLHMKNDLSIKQGIVWDKFEKIYQKHKLQIIQERRSLEFFYDQKETPSKYLFYKIAMAVHQNLIAVWGQVKFHHKNLKY